MTTSKVRTGPNIDPFRSRQVPEVARRWREARDRQRQQADLMWLGSMIASFSDHDLKLLSDLGFMCPHDRDLLAKAGHRSESEGEVRPVPINAAPPASV